MTSSFISGDSHLFFNFADSLYPFILSTVECTDAIFTQPYLLNDCFRSAWFTDLCVHESFAAAVFGFWETANNDL